MTSPSLHSGCPSATSHGQIVDSSVCRTAPLRFIPVRLCGPGSLAFVKTVDFFVFFLGRGSAVFCSCNRLVDEVAGFLVFFFGRGFGETASGRRLCTDGFGAFILWICD